MDNFLKELFIDEVKGCLGSDSGGGGEYDIASDEDVTQVIHGIFNSSSVATEEEVSDVFDERMV